MSVDNLDKTKEISPSLQKAEILSMRPDQLATLVANLIESNETVIFIKKVLQDDQLTAWVSYWEKFLPEEFNSLFDSAFSEARQDQLEDDMGLPLDLEKKFTHDELATLFSRNGALQLTFGTSPSHVGFVLNSPIGVRSKMNFRQVENLMKTYGEYIGEGKWDLYAASEPSDHENFPEIHGLAVKHGNYYPGILTNEVEDEVWLKFLSDSVRASVRLTLSKDDPNYSKIRDDRKGNIEVQVGDKTVKLDNFEKAFAGNFDVTHKNVTSGLNGSLITPRGIYNVICNNCEKSDEMPTGEYVVPLGPLSESDISEGDTIQDVLSNSLIMNVVNGNEYQMKRKDAVWKVVIKDGVVTHSHKLNIVIPDEEAERKTFFSGLKKKWLNDPGIRRNVSDSEGKVSPDFAATIIKLLRDNADGAEFKPDFWSRNKYDPGMIDFEITFDQSQFPELHDTVTVHFGCSANFEFDWMNIYCDFKNKKKPRKFPKLEELYFDKTVGLIKAELEAGNLSIHRDSRQCGLIDFQALIDKLYNSDFSELEIKSDKQTYSGAYIRQIEDLTTWQWLFKFNNLNGEEIHATFLVELDPHESKLNKITLWLNDEGVYTNAMS